jgi:hypothetical protein
MNPFNGIERRMTRTYTSPMSLQEENPFNGIERVSSCSSMISIRGTLRIHSMELKEANGV